jgi:hypothetical protein
VNGNAKENDTKWSLVTMTISCQTQFPGL